VRSQADDQGDAVHRSGSSMRTLLAAAILSFALVATPAALAGGRIAYTSTAGGNPDVWTIDTDGAAYPSDLTMNSPGVDQSPAWSPDGTRIAFISDRGGGFDVWLVDANGGNPVQLTHDGGAGASTATPAWSPDGTQIAFASTRSNGSWAIWAIATDGSNLQRISPGFGVDPAWSPDAARLAYVSFDAVHVMNADGSGDHMITDGSAPDSAPSWSPDGSRIAFGRYNLDWRTTNVKEIWTALADGSQPQQLTHFGAYADRPSWSPDGSRLAFQLTGPRGDSSLGTIGLDGSAATFFANAPQAFGPSWGAPGPGIDIRIPRDGAELGLDWIVQAHYICGPTAVTCVGTLPEGALVDTSRPGRFSFTVTATDAAGHRSTAESKYTVVDKTPPRVDFRSPCCDNPQYELGATIATDFSCNDGTYGSGVDICRGDGFLDTASIGQHFFVVQTRDLAGNSGTSEEAYRVVWPFAFASSLALPPAFNSVRAGEGVAVKIFLGGDRGLDVLDPSYVTVDCETGAVQSGGGTVGRLSYNASQERYTFLWPTDRSQAGTCGHLVLALRDGTRHEVWFRFAR
jgi:hypothetical protein